MLGYFIVIAGLGFLFTKMTISVLEWSQTDKTPPRTHHMSDNGIMDEVIRDEGAE